jgi:hypothetical protein
MKLKNSKQAASRDNISTQVKESESIEGIKVSPELTEMLYKTAKQRIDKTVSKFMKEHPEYFEDSNNNNNKNKKGAIE